MLISSLAVQSLCFGMNTKLKQSKYFPVLRGQDVLVRMDSSTVDSYMQSERDMLPSPVKAVLLSAVVVHCWFFVSKSHPCPGHLNLGLDLLSRGFCLVREWRFHPLIVAQFWDLFGPCSSP